MQRRIRPWARFEDGNLLAYFKVGPECEIFGAYCPEKSGVPAVIGEEVQSWHSDLGEWGVLFSLCDAIEVDDEEVRELGDGIVFVLIAFVS